MLDVVLLCKKHESQEVWKYNRNKKRSGNKILQGKKNYSFQLTLIELCKSCHAAQNHI